MINKFSLFQKINFFFKLATTPPRVRVYSPEDDSSFDPNATVSYDLKGVSNDSRLKTHPAWNETETVKDDKGNLIEQKKWSFAAAEAIAKSHHYGDRSWERLLQSYEQPCHPQVVFDVLKKGEEFIEKMKKYDPELIKYIPEGTKFWTNVGGTSDNYHKYVQIFQKLTENGREQIVGPKTLIDIGPPNSPFIILMRSGRDNFSPEDHTKVDLIPEYKMEGYIQKKKKEAESGPKSYSHEGISGIGKFEINDLDNFIIQYNFKDKIESPRLFTKGELTLNNEEESYFIIDAAENYVLIDLKKRPKKPDLVVNEMSEEEQSDLFKLYEDLLEMTECSHILYNNEQANNRKNAKRKSPKPTPEPESTPEPTPEPAQPIEIKEYKYRAVIFNKSNIEIEQLYPYVESNYRAHSQIESFLEKLTIGERSRYEGYIIRSEVDKSDPKKPIKKPINNKEKALKVIRKEDVNDFTSVSDAIYYRDGMKIAKNKINKIIKLALKIQNKYLN